LKIKSDAPVNGLRFHTTNAAGFGEAIAEKAEVGRHRAKMEGKRLLAKLRCAKGPHLIKGHLQSATPKPMGSE